jgi:hypothetical protein
MGKERVIEIKRQRLKSFMNEFNMGNPLPKSIKCFEKKSRRDEFLFVSETRAGED